MPRSILIAVSDLMFQPRIAEAVRRAGLESRTVDSATDAERVLADGAAGVVVDLHDAAFEPADVIRRAKAAGVPVLAFGRHTDAPALRAAREAGADRVVPRSQLVEELPSLLAALVEAAAAHVPDRTE